MAASQETILQCSCSALPINFDLRISKSFFILSAEQNAYHWQLLFMGNGRNWKLKWVELEWFERSVYWDEYKTKSDGKNVTNEFILFLESNFVGVNRLFVFLSGSKSSIFSTELQIWICSDGILVLTKTVFGEHFVSQCFERL